MSFQESTVREHDLARVPSTSPSVSIRDDQSEKLLPLREEVESTEPTSPVAQASVFDRPRKFAYLDHTADVMIHAWSSCLPGAFAQCLLGLYGIMLNIEQVQVCPTMDAQTWTAEGHDLKSLLYNFLEEGLYRFHVDGFVAARVIVDEWQAPIDDTALAEDDVGVDEAAAPDQENAFRMRVLAYGEQYDGVKHESGTEVKAITYSAMTIRRRRLEEASTEADPDRVYQVFVIVDI